MKTLCIILFFSFSFSQIGYPLYQKEFTKEEFKERYAKLFKQIGENVALIQGAPTPVGYSRFRQYNEFYYLSGIESPHAYLMLDGRSKRVTVFLQHRNTRREYGEGQVLSVEDRDFLLKNTPVDAVMGTERLNEMLGYVARSSKPIKIYTPFQPMEGKAVSRDLALRRNADIQSDPYDGRIDRSAVFRQKLKKRYPQMKLADLSPILDEMRLIKSPAEIAVLKKATDLSCEALMACMRSVKPGMYEYELDGLAKLIFHRNNSQGDAYYSLIATSTNAYHNHYNAGQAVMEDGHFVLMDYAPDYKYYMSDVTRQFPANGKFNAWQRELYQFYLDTYKAFLKHIKVGKTAKQIRAAAHKDWKKILKNTTFSKDIYQKAAERFVENFGKSQYPGLGHWVGMATHDVGVWKGPLKEGMVFTIEPQFRVPEERIYIRLEDMIVVTKNGVDIISDYVPMEIDDIEKLMAEKGLLEYHKKMD